jgi:hypothetical protein
MFQNRVYKKPTGEGGTMKGWKTWAGAAIIAGSAILQYFGYSDFAGVLISFGAALGIVGLGHKIEKTVVKQGEENEN